MTKGKKESIDKFLSEILNESEMVNHYEVSDFGDEDINYIVSPKLNGLNVKNNKLQFILYCSGKESLTLYCPILYKVKDTDSLMYTLNIINNINSEMAIGKIYLNQNNSTVVAYLNRVLFTDITNELTPTLLNEYIHAFLLCSIKFYHEVKEI